MILNYKYIRICDMMMIVNVNKQIPGTVYKSRRIDVQYSYQHQRRGARSVSDDCTRESRL